MILISLSYFIYDNYFSLKAKANQVVENIYKGEFNYSPVLGGKILVSKEIMSDEIVTEFLLNTNKKVSPESKIEMRTFVFDIPQNIIKYDLTKTWSNKTKITLAEDVSEKWYNELFANLPQLYSSYDDYLRKEIDTYKEKMNYKFVDSIKQITYEIDNIPEERFYYRVETTSDVKRMQLVFYNIPDKGWKLVSILQNNI